MRAGGLSRLWGRAAHVIGRLTQSLCLPDPLIGWIPFALPEALRVVRDEQVSVILATARPFTSLILGSLVSRWTHCPLVLDYRDPWTTQTDPASRPPLFRRIPERAIERRVAKPASHILFSSRARARQYVEVMGKEVSGRTSWLPNAIEPAPSTTGGSEAGQPLPILLHAGNLYGGRSLIPLLKSMLLLDAAGLLTPSQLRIELRGLLDGATRRYLEDSPSAARYLRTEPPIPQDAIRSRMARARGLLLIVAPEHHADVPAKLFDYLGSGRPILCLGPNHAEAVDLVRRLGAGICVEPTDEHGLREALLGLARGGIKCSLNREAVAEFEVQSFTAKLSAVLNQVRAL